MEWDPINKTCLLCPYTEEHWDGTGLHSPENALTWFKMLQGHATKVESEHQNRREALLYV